MKQMVDYAADKLGPALVKVFAEMRNPGASAQNPHFGSRYAPLHEILELARAVCAKHGLAIVQSTSTREDGRTGCCTIFVHESGQMLRTDTIYLKDRKDDAQGAGSCITYARRYSLCAALGIAADPDDDGYAASQDPPARRLKPEKSPAGGDVTGTRASFDLAMKLADYFSECQHKGEYDRVNKQFKDACEAHKITAADAKKIVVPARTKADGRLGFEGVEF